MSTPPTNCSAPVYEELRKLAARLSRSPLQLTCNLAAPPASKHFQFSRYSPPVSGLEGVVAVAVRERQ